MFPVTRALAAEQVELLPTDGGTARERHKQRHAHVIEIDVRDLVNVDAMEIFKHWAECGIVRITRAEPRVPFHSELHPHHIARGTRGATESRWILHTIHTRGYARRSHRVVEEPTTTLAICDRW